MSHYSKLFIRSDRLVLDSVSWSARSLLARAVRLLGTIAGALKFCL